MQTMPFTTKRKADSMLVDSLFKPGKTLTREKYCAGKYNESIKTRTFEVRESIKALWVEKHKDADGNYWVVMCLHSD